MNHIAIQLRDIFFAKKTGRLIYRRKEILKYFFFDKGAILQVKTNQPDERLGEILNKLERIPKDAYSKIDEFIEPNASIGEVLKTRGVISEEDLAEALAHQIRESILNVFGVFDAEMEFQPQDSYASTGAESRVSVPLLIEYGIRRMQPDPLLKAFLAPRTPALGRKTYAYLLTLEEREILEKVNGKDAAEIILRTLTVPPDQYWKSLYLFYCLGVVDLAGDDVPAAPPPDLKSRLQPSVAANKDIPQAIAEVLAFRDMLPAMSLYQVLDVPKTASDEDIKKAYFQMARKFHPDRFDRTLVAEFKTPIAEVFDGITNAYKVLSNKDSRRAYDAKAGTAAPQDDVQEQYRRADTKFRQGKTLHGQGRYDEAIAYLEEAIRLRRDKADYFLLLAMCESRVKAYVKKAEQDFLKAIQLEPWNPEGYFGLGTLYKAEGMQTRAIKQFEKAVEAEPDHAKAREALEDLTGGPKKGPKSIFQFDLFGSKKKKK
jgi:curved DNA-binding protein CbpA